MPQKDINSLPTNWKYEPIKSIAAQADTVNPMKEPDEFIGYIDISSIDNREYKLGQIKSILGREAPSRARKVVSEGSVLFATTRPSLKNIAIAESISRAVASTGFCVINTFSDKLLGKYLFYYLITDKLQEAITPFIRGAQYPAISDKDLMNVPIPYPIKIQEQQRIVSKLDAIFKKLDNAIQLAEENVEHLQHMIPSALNEVFETIEKKDNKVSLAKHVEFIGGSQPAKTHFSYEEKKGFVRLIQIRDYKSDNHKVYINEKSTTKFSDVDDVMIGRYGPPVFQILRGLKGAYNVALMKAQPDESILSKDYLYWFLQNPNIQNYVIGISQRAAGQSGVNKDALEKYKITIPSTKVQGKIVKYFEQLSQKKTELEHFYESKLKYLRDLKESILDSAFKGEL